MNRKENEQGRCRTASIVGLMFVGLALLTAGCGRSESSAGETETTLPRPAKDEATALAATIPAPVIPEDAPVLSDVYPTLSSGALRLARLTALADGVLLQAEGFSLTERDLQAEIAQAPDAARDELRKNAFFLLEQKATMDLLLGLARRRVGTAAKDDNDLLQRYFQDLTKSINVTDSEISAFYDENRELVRGASLEQVKTQISDHLRRQKEQELIESHVAELGREITIAVSSEWIREQAVLAMDNPMDKARTSGKPTFVNFGSKGCVPCDMMEPIREELASEYAGKVNIVYINVNNERILASRYGVRGIPHLVFFDKDGKQMHTHTGFMAKEQIEAQFRKMGVKSE